MASLKDDLQASGLELRETHISWVFLGSTAVWKVKKPVDFGFLDFSALPRRLAACRAEVELNRRLAAGVYLGVVPVTRDADGKHRLGGEGEAVDWAVHMRRLPDTHRADHRLANGSLTMGHLEAIAKRLAAFHGTARTDEAAARFGAPEVILTNVRENFAQTRDTIAEFLSPSEVAEIERFQLQFLDREAARLQLRCRSGRIRDGHGDIRLEHVYLDDGGEPTVLDCIEFNKRFRFADVCADIAFLFMDLEWHRRVDLAERLLAAYARESNDYDLYPLVDFYASYRAFVRAKVATFLANDADADQDARARGEAEARRYYLLSLALARRSPLSQTLAVVGGIIASGKSTVADQVAAALAWPVIATDRTRKHLSGVDPLQPMRHPAWEGAYSPAMSELVYRETLRRADAVLASGRSVVVDGSFRTRAERAAAARLAAARGVSFLFIECRADPAVCRARLADRATRPSVSDGRLEIFDDFAAGWEPVTEFDLASHVVVDTTQPLEGNLDTLCRRLPGWPPGLTG